MANDLKQPTGESSTTEDHIPAGTPTKAAVREILGRHGRLAGAVADLDDSSDLHSAGLTSLATVGLMLALEERFEIEFPDSLLSRKTFSSIDALTAAVDGLRTARAV